MYSKGSWFFFFLLTWNPSIGYDCYIFFKCSAFDIEFSLCQTFVWRE